jgi:DnaJ family protein C protein 2
MLLDPVKRRQFDSVDEGANVDPPLKKEAQKKGWFKSWGPVFDSEGRFSKTQPVPRLGNDKSSKEEVETFYNFWYNFDSWRSFEYQDEDVPDDNENRDQKRHVERKNNNARKKKKVEDTKRLRELVDECLAGDERIKKFRKEERAGKDKKRLEREAAEKKEREEKLKAAEEKERSEKEKAEVDKVEKAEGKKAKEAAKNAVKKNKRVLKGSVKDVNYLMPAGESASAKRIDGVLNDVEVLMAKMEPEDIATLAGKLNGLKVADEVGKAWSGEVERLQSAGKVKEGETKVWGVK